MIRLIAVTIVLFLAWQGFQAFRFVATAPGSESEKVIFSVFAGSSFRRVAQDLEAQGLVSSSYKLRIFAKLTGLGAQVKQGEYALDKGMSPRQILNVLVSGKSIQYPITFPEGANIYEMAMALESKKMFRADEFLAMVKQEKLVEDLLGTPGTSLEGYLFPETYNVTKFTPLKELLRAMVQNFKLAYETIEKEARQKGELPSLSRHELVTLASIVEKETGAPEERSQIASVFYNRLRKNMRLQSDPTIIYGIWDQTGQYKQNIQKDDILRPTRYNTYTIPRLPAGPIGNPGRESLRAVFFPAATEFLYFVSRNQGTHIFTRTYEEHTKAVRSFQMDPKAREGKSWRQRR